MSRARLSYPDAKSFYNILEALSKLVDEVVMIIKPDGVKAMALDPAHIALVAIELPPESFVEYEVEGDEVRLGFNVTNTMKIVKRSKKGDKLDIDVAASEVKWSIIGATVKSFKVLNLDIPIPEIPEASFKFNVKLSMIVDPFKNALKDVEAVSDTVELEAKDEDLFVIRGVGATVSETRIKRDTPAVIEYEVKEPSKSVYSIDYLKHIISLTKVADVVTLEFSSEMPLHLQFQLPAGGRVEYLLAPKSV